MEYIERKKCVITGAMDIEPLYQLKDFPVFIGCTAEPQENDIFADMDWGISKSSGIVQLLRLLPLKVVYSSFHSEAVGKIWKDHHDLFANFIIENVKGESVFEMGGSNGSLAVNVVKSGKISNWLIVEPNPNENSALLSEKINKLSEHFKNFKKDKHSARGLTKSVNQRKRLLDYLSKNDPKSYNDILKKLNLRK